MSDWTFAVTNGRAVPFAAAPTLAFTLRIAEAGGAEVHAITLRTQIRIEPRRRRYSPAEEERLVELFGEPSQWGDSLQPLLWTHVSLTVPAFCGSTEVDLPVPCTYDFEVASSKYFHSLDQGEVPLLFLFSGSVFLKNGDGFSVEPVSWEQEAAYRLPAAVWRQVMDAYFPNSAWLRLGRESFDALHRFKGRRALPSWDAAIQALLQLAGEGPTV
jgi:hypothetical protein